MGWRLNHEEPAGCGGTSSRDEQGVQHDANTGRSERFANTDLVTTLGARCTRDQRDVPRLCNQ